MAEGAKIALEDLPKLSVEQINQVKEQLEAETGVLNDSSSNIREASTRLELALKALKQLSVQSEGKSIMVPLTGSLYVPGKLKDTKKVLVDVGTGYFIEKSVDGGLDFCQRKISFLKENQKKIMELLNQKMQLIERVNMILRSKISSEAGKSS